MSSVIVGFACELQTLEFGDSGPLRHHTVYTRYLEGLQSVVATSPILIPAVGPTLSSPEFHAYASILDGLILPGGSSNLDPALYGSSLQENASPERDPARDSTTLPLIRACYDAGVPILGICRGMQELNVALGGTLLANVQALPNRRDHRSDKTLPLVERYGPAHALRVAAGSWLETTLNAAHIDVQLLQVNSLHSQCVDTLGRGVVAEAWADDTTVEAIRAANAPALTVGVQWHLEWHVESTPLHATILRAFGNACKERKRRREGHA